MLITPTGYTRPFGPLCLAHSQIEPFFEKVRFQIPSKLQFGTFEIFRIPTRAHPPRFQIPSKFPKITLISSFAFPGFEYPETRSWNFEVSI